MTLKNMDLNDYINRFYMIHKGLIKPDPTRTYNYSMLASYFDYVSNLSNITVKNNTDTKAITHSTKFFQSFELRVASRSNTVRLNEIEIADLFDKVRNAVKTLDVTHLTDDQFKFFYSNNITELTDYVSSLNLPEIEFIEKEKYPQELNEILLEISSDSRFKAQKIIKHIYKPHVPTKSFGEDWQKMTLAHGTKNRSLLEIIAKGFKTNGQLESENNKHYQYSGNAFGDAVYFARPNQIAKTLGYIGHEKSAYIIIADVYYKNIVNDNCVYDGENMRISQYSNGNADEHMVLPNQIQIKYILEIV